MFSSTRYTLVGLLLLIVGFLTLKILIGSIILFLGVIVLSVGNVLSVWGYIPGHKKIDTKIGPFLNSHPKLLKIFKFIFGEKKQIKTNIKS